jgi:hypothetical protein
LHVAAAFGENCPGVEILFARLNKQDAIIGATQPSATREILLPGGLHDH